MDIPNLLKNIIIRMKSFEDHEIDLQTIFLIIFLFAFGSYVVIKFVDLLEVYEDALIGAYREYSFINVINNDS